MTARKPKEPESKPLPSYMQPKFKQKRRIVVCALCKGKHKGALRKVGGTYVHVECLTVDAQIGLMKQNRERNHGR